MVAAGASAFDLHDDRVVRYLGGDADHRTDLLDGAGLECDETQSCLDEFVDEGHGVLEFGDTRRHDHAVDRSALRPRLLHETLAAELELPQVRIKEQRIELCLAAGLEEVGERGDVAREDLFGHLATAGEFGPVARVCRGGDDRRVNGGRGHARKQHRRAPGQSGERRLHDAPTVGELSQRRGEVRPTACDLRNSTGAEQVSLTSAKCGGHQADALPPNERRGESRCEIAGTEIENPRGAVGDHGVDLSNPVDRCDQNRFGVTGGEVGVDTARLRPLAHQIDRRCHAGVVECDADAKRVEDGGEGRAAGDLALAVVGLGGHDALALRRERREVPGCAGQHNRTSAVANGDHGCGDQFGVGQPRAVGREDFVDACRGNVGDRQHRRAVGTARQATTSSNERARGGDEMRDRK